jgi:uncharacterized delta-60 repeat protein
MNFGPNPGSAVDAVAIQEDGKIVIAGRFQTLSGSPSPYVARLLADGTLDPEFTPLTGNWGQAAEVFTVAVRANGSILLGGDFSRVNGTPHQNFVQLLTDGEVDPDWVAGGPNGIVYDVALIGRGGIPMIAGTFTNYNNQTQHYVARLLSNGNLDPVFNPVPGPDAFVNAVVAQPDGKVIIGGDFNKVNGVSHAKLARLFTDGTLDTNYTAFADGTVASLALQPDTNLVIGGVFTKVNNHVRYGIARLKSTGVLDDSFKATPGITGEIFPGVPATVKSIAVQPDGKILIAGRFTNVNGIPQNSLARLNTDGTVDTRFIASGSGGVFPQVNSVVIQTNGQVLVAGEFTTMNGTNRLRVARLNGGDAMPPHIIVQPQNTNAPFGDPLTLNVGADGTIPLGYQWRRNGINLRGQRDSTLTFGSATFDLAGNYTVVVTNLGGSVTSQVAVVSISPSALTILGHKDGSNFTVQAQTYIGKNYTLEAKTNLVLPNWSTVVVLPGNNNIRSFTDTNSAPAKFFRIRID